MIYLLLGFIAGLFVPAPYDELFKKYSRLAWQKISDKLKDYFQ